MHNNMCICIFLTVSSGTVTINEDSSLQVLAEEAVPLEQLDMSVSDQISLCIISIISSLCIHIQIKTTIIMV